MHYPYLVLINTRRVPYPTRNIQKETHAFQRERCTLLFNRFRCVSPFVGAFALTLSGATAMRRFSSGSPLHTPPPRPQHTQIPSATPTGCRSPCGSNSPRSGPETWQLDAGWRWWIWTTVANPASRLHIWARAFHDRNYQELSPGWSSTTWYYVTEQKARLRRQNAGGDGLRIPACSKHARYCATTALLVFCRDGANKTNLSKFPRPSKIFLVIQRTR